MFTSAGDGSVHPQSPVFLLLSTDGVLIPFYVINQQNGAPILNKPVTALSAQGERKPKGKKLYPNTALSGHGKHKPKGEKLYWGTKVWNIDINFVFIKIQIKKTKKTYV